MKTYSKVSELISKMAFSIDLGIFVSQRYMLSVIEKNMSGLQSVSKSPKNELPILRYEFRRERVPTYLESVTYCA